MANAIALFIGIAVLLLVIVSVYGVGQHVSEIIVGLFRLVFTLALFGGGLVLLLGVGNLPGAIGLCMMVWSGFIVKGMLAEHRIP